MTNNIRIYLWVALGVILYFNYEAWTRDYGPRPDLTPPAVVTGKSGSSAADSLGNQIPQASAPSGAAKAPNANTASAGNASGTAAATAGAVPDNTERPTTAAQLVQVHTDVLDIDISTRGGTIVRADLLKYPKVKGESTPVRLENEDDPTSLYELQSGLAGPSGNTPTHLANFTATDRTYALTSGDELRVPLTWTGDNGITVTKTFVFHRGQYRIDVEYAVENHSDAAWQVNQYTQIERNDPRTSSSMFNYSAEKSQFHGPALYYGTKLRKLNFAADSDDRHLDLQVQNGWIAALQHHFVTAVVPPKDQDFRFKLTSAGDRYVLSAAGPLQTVAAGASGKLSETLFIGPKLQDQLDAAGPRLDLVTDYWYLTIIARPLFWLLSILHKVFGNWGVAIILATFVLKAVFYPLAEISGRSSAKMKLVQPRIKNLQELYKDDREKLSKAMMELYQREKINPVSGCLPMLIQIPVFLAFYWTLLESVEIRQAPFFGWIQDLSSRDPYFILPALMAGAMFVQFKINPTSPDPTQAKIMMVMPLIMSVTLAFFPAGLVLYWTTNTLLTILQQWNINRRIATSASAAKRN
ncbi:MAG TPA: membrane protein insertase YidC [Steroidobacteraceae bacterium]